MSLPILATKLFAPPPRPGAVRRQRLVDRLDEGLRRRLTLVSAAAGFGKTTLVSTWLEGHRGDDRLHIAWLSLDEADGDPARFLAYLVASVAAVVPEFGEELAQLLQTPQPPPLASALTSLLNEFTAIPEDLLIVLDDYHLVESRAVDDALGFILEHLPPRVHFVIASREDPQLPLGRLRARGQLAELRAADLRFTAAEAADFLKEALPLTLSEPEMEALEKRTEGWVAGLQLAALALQAEDRPRGSAFVEAFTGSHRFVMDYLVEEVLKRQPEAVQSFLLHTSILGRLSGPLCDAVLGDGSAGGQTMLEHLERANLFLIPLDSDRRWYRYHHLFADLLRVHLRPQAADPARWTRLHERASRWFEENGFDLEAFQHAAAAGDIDRAERLIGGRGIPRHSRDAAAAMLHWLESLPREAMDARPALWWRHASLLLINGQATGVEEKLRSAEAALAAQGLGQNDASARALTGHIAGARSVLALTRYDPAAMLAQSRQALENLPAADLSARANATWVLGYAQLFAGDRVNARDALSDAAALSQAAGDTFTDILASIGLGNVQEADNQLGFATATYQRVLRLASDQPTQIVYEAHLGLARVMYERNDLEGAAEQGEAALALARQYESVIDRYIVCEVFLARLRTALGDLSGAAVILDQAAESARRFNFVHRLPEVAAAQALLLIRRGDLSEAARLADLSRQPLVQVRLQLARGETAAALTGLEAARRPAEAKGWRDESLRLTVVEAVVRQAGGDGQGAVRALASALAEAEREGFVRLFVDEGAPMVRLLSEAARGGAHAGYAAQLLTAFQGPSNRPAASAQPLVDPLSKRELEILGLVAEGLSNQEIAVRLFLALSTVKSHVHVIFEKIQVKRRTEAVARARELGLL